MKNPRTVLTNRRLMILGWHLFVTAVILLPVAYFVVDAIAGPDRKIDELDILRAAQTLVSVLAGLALATVGYLAWWANRGRNNTEILKAIADTAMVTADRAEARANLADGRATAASERANAAAERSNLSETRANTAEKRLDKIEEEQQLLRALMVEICPQAVVEWEKRIKKLRSMGDEGPPLPPAPRRTAGGKQRRETAKT